MRKLRPFQIILLAAFGFFALISIVLLSGFSSAGPTDKSAYGRQVIIWGSFDQEVMNNILDDIAKDDKAFEVVEYHEKDPLTFDFELLNAIAEGRAPDLIVLRHDRLVTNRVKLLSIPYETISKREFRDSYVDGAEIFARPDGIYALPIAVDPLVMYWNRDILASNGLAAAPTTWEEIVNVVAPAITITKDNRDIVLSTLAFGEYRNVVHSKEILSMLMMQSGSGLIDESDIGYSVLLNETSPIGGNPLETSLQFYTTFSNVTSRLYSWKRAQRDDRDEFVSGDLALYFGLGSELDLLKRQNPNLNFDVAPVPQGVSASIKRTHGTFYGFAIVRATANPPCGFAAARTTANP